ncbi:MAG TPA: response regulator [Rhodocyclaceae bacterium]|nr:response regulator [Rhodocyclaceae bacterium]
MNAAAPISLYSRARPRALVVENDVELAPLLDLLLQGEAYDVTLVADGRQAMQAINRLAPPDLVLLETFLPYRGGFELLQQIRSRANWDAVRVIMLSNNAGGTDALRARAGGADGCLVKPLRPEALLELLSQPTPWHAAPAEKRYAVA